MTDLRLYLIQHGEAKREEEDHLRPLTDRGREEVEGVASVGVSVDEVVHSGKLRYWRST